MTQDYYQNGMDANADGILKANCPHAEGTGAHTQWMRGFNDFQPIREEWEAEVDTRSIQSDNDRLISSMRYY